MQIDDILNAAIQDANLDELICSSNPTTIDVNENHNDAHPQHQHHQQQHVDLDKNNNNLGLIDDPFSTAIRELEIHNKKADEIIKKTKGDSNSYCETSSDDGDEQVGTNTTTTTTQFTPLTTTTNIQTINIHRVPSQQQQLTTNAINKTPTQIKIVKLNKSQSITDLQSLINFRSTTPTTTTTTSNNQIKIVHLTPIKTPLTTIQQTQTTIVAGRPSPSAATIIQIPKQIITNGGNNTLPSFRFTKQLSTPIQTANIPQSSNVQITKVVSSRLPTAGSISNAHFRTSAPLLRICSGGASLNGVVNASSSSSNGGAERIVLNLNDYLAPSGGIHAHHHNHHHADEEIVADEEEELGHAETYADYMPSKLQIGIRHPDPVVETSSLASVEPPDVWYKLRIPESTYADGALSALQLEAIVYASQKHETFLPNNHRSGFLIGDGAGVGKGRTIAGIIYENYLLSRKRALWLSVSNDLKYDAQRDLNDIGAHRIDVHALNKLKYTKISSKSNLKIKKGVIFATYSSLIGESQQTSTKNKYNTRMKQLLQWLGKDFDGVIVFDECHKAKNLVPVGSAKPTKTGLAVLELQEKLPNARIVYASATGASEPKNMAYMVRLGLWGPGTPFNDFNEFIQCIEKRGVGAMEIVAMDMKLRGMYMARQLSFSGVTFKIQEIKLTEDYVRMYDESVKLWVYMKEKFQEGLDLVDTDGRLRKTVWGQFWSAHQRFFKYLCMASKVTHVVDLTRNALHSNKCVVVGLQSTGEARTLEQLDEYGEINEFISTARGVLHNLIEKHYPMLSQVANTTNGNGGSNGSANGGSSKQTFLDILGVGDHIREQINKKQQQNESKNSRKVNEIVKRLSSYTNKAAKLPENKSSAANGKSGKNVSSSSSSSSGSSSSGEDNEENDDEDEDDDGESSLLSDDYESSQEENEPPQAQTSQPQQQPLMTTQQSQAAFDSDDSDSLFSIHRSNITFTKRQNSTASATTTTTTQQIQQQSSQTNTLKSHKKRKKLKKKKTKGDTDNYGNDEECEDSDECTNQSDLDETTVKKPKLEATTTTTSSQSPTNQQQQQTNDYEQQKQRFELVKKSRNMQDRHQYLNEIRGELLNRLNDLSKRLPPNTLDELIDNLDGPAYVAEMTGRKGRVVCHEDGNYVYETRSETDVPLELLNVVQKERFMSGEKLIAIISEAASSGISLQANRRYANQRRRVHITIELPWSADRAIQQFGRTHRSNQVSAPEYIFLISELAGEKRFASTVAKRLESLGALTHGDRRATETRDLSQFNIDNKYGRAALENVIKSICGLEKPLAKPPTTPANFLMQAREALIGVGMIIRSEKTSGPGSLNGYNTVFPDKDYTNINKFLNRLLGCPVHLQNAIFTYFSDVLAAVILDAKRTGKWDMGILDLGTNNNETVLRYQTKFYVLNNTANGTITDRNKRVELHQVAVERGVLWSKAVDLCANCKGDEGFYLSLSIKNNHRIAILALKSQSKQTPPSTTTTTTIIETNSNSNNTSSDNDKKQEQQKTITFCIYRPNTGLQVRQETLETLTKKYRKVDANEAKQHWEEQYQKSLYECTHLYRQGVCTNKRTCELGLRNRKFHILAGSVLTVWTKIENVLSTFTGSHQFRLQIIRVRTADNQKIVGCVIPNTCVQQVDSLLSTLSVNMYKQEFHNNGDSSTVSSTPIMTTVAQTPSIAFYNNNKQQLLLNRNPLTTSSTPVLPTTIAKININNNNNTLKSTTLNNNNNNNDEDIDDDLDDSINLKLFNTKPPIILPTSFNNEFI